MNAFLPSVVLERTTIDASCWRRLRNAQVRLCARYRRLAARGKPQTVVTTAIAREMAAFIWAIARVKGAGEAGAVGAPPAVINAIVDALHRRVGLRHIDMPATPRRLWEMLNGI